MYKRITLFCIVVMFCCFLSGCQCEHEWIDANCTTPKTCSLCDDTEGEPIGHNWIAATCTAPETCSICGKYNGVPLGHNWLPATCEQAETCTFCGEENGDPLEHTKGDWAVTQDATVYQVGIREQKCTVCGTTIRSEEFYPDPVFFVNDFGMSTSEFISTFNKLANGDYEIKPDGDDYVVHWLGVLDISTSISFTENSLGYLTSINLDGREMAKNGNQQVKVCWTMFRVLNPHLSESDSMDEFKYAANSGGKEFIRGARYLYTELSSLDVLWFTIQID